MTGGGTQLRSRHLTRRQLLKGAAGGAGAVALGGGAFGATRLLAHPRRLPSHSSTSRGPARDFVTRPDLHPPVTGVTDARASLGDAIGGGTAPGYLFLSPSAAGPVQAGPMIVDHQGEPVWFQPVARSLWATDTRLAEYRGRPVVTWWEGKMQLIGFGTGEGVIADSSYRELARVRAGNGRSIDIHEFMVTPQGTALFTCFPQRVQQDLSSIGGPSDGSVLEGVIQEVDIASGRVLFEWRSLDHIPVSDSFFPPKIYYGYDYLHVNSIDIAPDGNLLLSARHTWALYKIHRRTGEVMWRLGGKSSDFHLADDAQFYWQHDARHRSDGTISVFDDGAAWFAAGQGRRTNEQTSRGVVLDIDEGGRSVQLVRSYRHPGKRVLANAMGNFQTLPDGHVVIGWGSSPVASEFSPDGLLIADTDLGAKHDSYRAYWFPWTGTPAEHPILVAKPERHSGTSTLFVSWNGSTETVSWLISTGASARDLRPTGIAARHGFETVIPLRTRKSHVRVTALDSRGHHVASSRVVRL